jgi:hypothetical protein
MEHVPEDSEVPKNTSFREPISPIRGYPVGTV